MMASILPFPPDEEREFQPEPVPYEENPDFNDSLDNSYKAIEIAGTSFPASRVLHTMDPDAYRAALIDFRQQQEDELKELVISRFPTPIANRFDKVENGCARDSERLSVLKDVWESIIYVLYALVVGEFRCMAEPFSNAKLILPSGSERLKFAQLFSDKLSDRIGITSGLLMFALEHSLDTVFTEIVSPDVLETIRILNQARNGFAHDETKSEEQARDLYATYYPEVLDVLGQLQGLADVKLLRYEGTVRTALSVRFEEFVGHAMSRHYRTIQLTSAQHSKYALHLSTETVVAYYRDRIYGLSPFLYFVSRDGGHLTKLCFFKRREGAATSQIFFFSVVGESTNEKVSAMTFETESNALRDLVTPPQASRPEG